MPLTPGELERLRLILSTFQDGSGWQKIQGASVFGYRQFERALAEVLSGDADENKALFDVIAERDITGVKQRVGFSCKLRSELGSVANKGTVYIEVSNAVSQFTKHLKTLGMNSPADYAANPPGAGMGVLDWVHTLHNQDASNRGIHLAGSVYLVLLYDATATDFELFELPADVFLAGTGLAWSAGGSRLLAQLSGKMAVQWYWSAGHLKFYVPTAQCSWRSGVFHLEPLATGARTLSARADEMFPSQWASATLLP